MTVITALRRFAPLLRLDAGRATLLTTHDTRLAALVHETVELRADGRTHRRQSATTSTITRTTSATTATTPITAGEIGRVDAAGGIGRSGSGEVGAVTAPAGAGGVGAGGVTGAMAGRAGVGCTRAAGRPDSVLGDDRLDRPDGRCGNPQIAMAPSLRERGDWRIARTLPPGPAAMRAN